MNIFDNYDLRKIIFSYLHPSKFKIGMKIKIYRSIFHPFLKNTEKTIEDIEEINKKSYICVSKEGKDFNEYWFKTISYLSIDRGDVFRVVKI